MGEKYVMQIIQAKNKMKYILDTDHLSIVQRQTGLDYANLSNKRTI